MALTFRPAPIMTLAALPALALLLTLGQWQWARFDMKRDAPPPQAVAEAIRPLEDVLATGPAERMPVRATGSWQPGAIQVYALVDGRRGARQFLRLETGAGAVLVDRGWVREGDVAPVPTGTGSVDGVLRAGVRANAFTPDNDPASGTWYWPDIPAMGQALGSPLATEAFYVAQITVDPLQTGTPTANPWADPKGADQLPAERHLGYALTWWGLAAALIGVWLAVQLRTGRIGWKRN